jgi:5-methylcytosine-specific restriction endonuclease McrA
MTMPHRRISLEGHPPPDRAAHLRMTPVKIWKRCPTCGSVFESIRKPGRPRQYCSRRCNLDRGTARFTGRSVAAEPCARCGNLTQRGNRRAGHRTFCSRVCRETYALKPRRSGTCDQCRAPFTTTQPQKRFCSADCRNDAKNGAWRSRPKRVHKYHRQKVLERDDWRCYLCQKAIDRMLIWPHPQAATVDHVTPVSAGGSNALTNLRAAHWSCNEAKGDALPGTEFWVPAEALA